MVKEEVLQGRRERKKLETWRTIRQTAMRLVNERGYTDVSLDDIALAADVSRATLFNYFPSKEAMLFAPDPEERQHWQTFMTSRPADEHPWVTLEAFFLDFTGRHEAKLKLQKELQAQVPGLNQINQEVNALLQTFLKQWLTDRLDAQNRRLEDVDLLLGLSFTAMGVAFAKWDAQQGFNLFRHRLQHTFQQVGRGMFSSL